MVQPPLDRHYVVRHLGGAKRVNRRRDGPTLSATAEAGSITIVPAGTAFVWKTEGPIAFSHLYIAPSELARCGFGEVDANGRGEVLIDCVGSRDALLERVLDKMLAEFAANPAPSRLLLDSLLEGFCIRLQQKHAPGRTSTAASAESLAPHRLRRVLDFIDANLGRDIALGDLVQAAGTSQFHFSRAFRLATGLSPYRYLTRSRVEYGRVLLLSSDASLPDISSMCGFNSRRQFASMFKDVIGVGPKRYRLARRSACRRTPADGADRACL